MMELMHQCKHLICSKVNEIGEMLAFCELTDRLENVTLGDCLGSCESQVCDGICRKDITMCAAWDTDKCLLHR